MPIRRWVSVNWLVTLWSLASVFIPVDIIGWSETRSRAPVGISFANPTVKMVAVSISMAMALVLMRYFLNLSSYSHTLLLVVYTVPV